MPRTNIPVTTVVEAGVAYPAATAGDATNDHSFTNDSRTILIFKNTGAGSQTLTVLTSQQINGLDVADRDYVVAAGAKRTAGPFPPQLYGQSTDSFKVWVNVAETTWEIEALSIP